MYRPAKTTFVRTPVFAVQKTAWELPSLTHSFQMLFFILATKRKGITIHVNVTRFLLSCYAHE
jgi:hypothetical protein